jgi:transposase-like protein
MNKSTKTEPTATVPAQPSPTVKRYDEAFQQEAVENGIKTGKPGTQIAAELGVSYPSLKDWKRRSRGDATPERDDLAAENRALKAEKVSVPAIGEFPAVLGHGHCRASPPRGGAGLSWGRVCGEFSQKPSRP